MIMMECKGGYWGQRGVFLPSLPFSLSVLMDTLMEAQSCYVHHNGGKLFSPDPARTTRLECSLEPSPGPILNQDQTLSQTPFPSSSPSHRDREEEDEDEEEGGNSGPGPEPVIGEHSDPEWVEERFRIDRKKLEAMLYGKFAEQV